MMRQLKQQKTKEAGAKVPDIEGLRKTQEDKTYGQWERYLIKQRDHRNKDRANAKKAKEIADHEAGKRLERREKIQTNLKAVRMDQKQLHDQIMAKIPRMEDKVDKIEKARKT